MTSSSPIRTAESPPLLEWHPLWALRKAPASSSYGFHLVILNQPIKHQALFTQLWNQAISRTAADAGADQVLKWAKRRYPEEAKKMEFAAPDRFEVDSPTRYQDSSQFALHAAFRRDHARLDRIMGDLDSLSDEARKFFTAITMDSPVAETDIICDPDQYSTDLTKVLRYVLLQQQQKGKSEDIVCMGGLGGRVDQGMSQLHHLHMFQGTGASEAAMTGSGSIKIYLLSEESLTILLRKGRHRIFAREEIDEGKKEGEIFGKHVGIIPLKGPARITTNGLEWDVLKWLTEFGGNMSTSNHIVKDVVEVETDEDVLFTIALK